MDVSISVSLLNWKNSHVVLFCQWPQRSFFDGSHGTLESRVAAAQTITIDGPLKQSSIHTHHFQFWVLKKSVLFLLTLIAEER